MEGCRGQAGMEVTAMTHWYGHDVVNGSSRRRRGGPDALPWAMAPGKNFYSRQTRRGQRAGPRTFKLVVLICFASVLSQRLVSWGVSHKLVREQLDKRQWSELCKGGLRSEF